MLGVVVGVVVGAVVVDGAAVVGARGGAGSAGGACASGGGAEGVGSTSAAGARGAVAGGVATRGGAVDGGTAGAPVVTGVLVSDFAGLSPTRSTAVTVPNPTASAPTHASASSTERRPIPGWSGGLLGAPSTAAGASTWPCCDGASSGPPAAGGSVGSSTTGVSDAVTPRICTIGAFRNQLRP